MKRPWFESASLDNLPPIVYIALLNQYSIELELIKGYRG